MVDNFFMVRKVRSSWTRNESLAFWPQVAPVGFTQVSRRPAPRGWWAVHSAHTLSGHFSALLPSRSPWNIYSSPAGQIYSPARVSNIFWVSWSSPGLQQDKEGIFFSLKISSWFTPPLTPTNAKKETVSKLEKNTHPLYPGGNWKISKHGNAINLLTIC